MMNPCRHLLLVIAALASLALCTVPAYAVDLYWDADTLAAGNDTFGNGTGGAGVWDTATTNWWNPSSPASNVVWADGNQAVFSGFGDLVVVPQNQTRNVTGLVFKSDGFTLDGGATATLGTTAFGATTANLEAAPGVTGTVATRMTGTGGFNVVGGGTIRLAPAVNVNTTTGPVSVTGDSTLDLAINGNIGGTGVGAGDITLNGGTLRNSSPLTTDVTFLTTNRNLVIGPLGGTINPQQVGLYGGIISGGVLTKIGPGELRLSRGAAQVNTHEKTIISEGMLSLGQSTTIGDDRNLGAVPASFMADNLTLGDGTMLRFLGAGGAGGDTVTLNANRGVVINGGVTINPTSATANGAILGSISGPGLITKASSFTLNLGGANTYSGGTIVSAGTLRVTNTSGSATGSEVVLLDAGGLDGTGTISNTVFAAANTRISAGLGNANSTLTLGGLQTTDNTTIINSLVGENGNDVLNITQVDGFNFSGGALLNIAASQATGSPAGKTYTLINYNSSFVGDILSNLTINNATGFDIVGGTVTNNLANTSIDVTFGTNSADKEWNVNADGNWSNDPAEAGNWDTPGSPNGVGTTARFLDIATAPVIVTISDVSKGVGHVVFDNANKYTIAAATTSQRLVFDTYDGNASIDVVSGSHEISARVTLTAETDITVPTGETFTFNGTTSAGVINNGGMNLTGGGTLVINQNWSGSGVTNIAEGKLLFAVGAAGLSSTGDVIIGASGTFDMNNIGDTFGYLNGPGPIINGANITLAGGNSTPAVYSGNYSGTGNFTKNGTGVQTLSGSNTFVTSTVGGGTLLVNNASGFALGNSGVTTVASAATLGGNGILGNAISVSAGGIIAPGPEGVNSVGTLTLDSAAPTAAVLTLATSTSRFSFDLGAGLTSDTIDLVNGAAGDIVFATGNNIINFTDTTSGSLTSGDYTLFTADVASAYAGTFAVDGSNLVTGGLTIGTGLTAYESAVLKLVGNDIVLSLTAASSPLLGDFNGDGFVNLADYTVWRDNLGAPEGDLLSGNGTGGTIDADDYAAWKSNFGAPNPGSLNVGESAAVPEPATVMTLLAGMAAAACCIRSRRSQS